MLKLAEPKSNYLDVRTLVKSTSTRMHVEQYQFLNCATFSQTFNSLSHTRTAQARESRAEAKKAADDGGICSDPPPQASEVRMKHTQQ